MARTKKADQAKDAAKKDKPTAQEAETPEKGQAAPQETETPEQGQAAPQETGTAEKDQDADQEAQEAPQDAPEPERDTDTTEGGDTPQGPQDEPERDIFADIPNPCVYCGPTMRGVARQYTTYQGGIPDELRDFIKEHPEARRLIVSTAQFPNLRKRLDTPGTAEAKLYKQVKGQL